MKKDCPRAIDHCGLKTCARWPPLHSMVGKFLGWLIGAGITPHIPVWKKLCYDARASGARARQTISSGALP